MLSGPARDAAAQLPSPNQAIARALQQNKGGGSSCGKPVIAGAVGGIPTQVVHKLTGVLVHSVEGCAYQLRYLLTHPEFAQQLGKNGREHVKENFLITTNLKRYLVLFQILLGVVQPRGAA